MIYVCGLFSPAKERKIPNIKNFVGWGVLLGSLKFFMLGLVDVFYLLLNYQGMCHEDMEQTPITQSALENLSDQRFEEFQADSLPAHLD